MKDVSQAVDAVLNVLRQLGDADALDEKLAEYAFFPFTHIFNESQRLSSRCLESALKSLAILVSRGWRQHLAPEMGKQLLILMTLVAGADAKKQLEPPSEDLKIAAYRCIALIVEQLTKASGTHCLFGDVGSKSIVDRLAYLLLESVTEESSAQVQLVAAEALLSIVGAVSNPLLLASLLPRTASSLTQSLRNSTKARRTRRVLITYLQVLNLMLRTVLADAVVYPLPIVSPASAATEALDGSWLQATATQVNLVMVQVLKLRDHEHADVRLAVADLCIMVVTDCTQSLSASLPIVVETMTCIAQNEQGGDLLTKLESMAISNPDIIDILATKLHDWIQSLPRIMQANDEKTKERLLGQVRVAITIVGHGSQISEDILATFAYRLLEAIAAFDRPAPWKLQPVVTETRSDSLTLEIEAGNSSRTFSPLVMTHSAQSQTILQLYQLLDTLRQSGLSKQVAGYLVDRIPELDSDQKTTATWLTISCLEDFDGLNASMLDMVNMPDDVSTVSRPRLISELYAAVLPCLLEDDRSEASKEWRLTAIAIEATVMQARQLETSYRPELIDTLYPILSLLGSTNSHLRMHAMTGLNLLADACKYSSTSDMLIDNVDYLINSVGMKLNSFDISPQAPQVLLMMLRLCGARILPFIDDLVGSIISALDNFHGYPKLVELLFQVLKAVIEESRLQPQLAITNSFSSPDHHAKLEQTSKLVDICGDMRRRKSRKRKLRETDEEPGRAPQRPWDTFESEIDSLERRNSQEAEDPAGEHSATTSLEEDKKKLSKSHQLLLSIARSTAPHLTSPSPQVRNILLQMLEEVSPLLAHDEDSFLPLINTVWPAVVPRLPDYSDDLSDAETAYNICAAAYAIATLCRGAGNFMSSRIDEVFPKVRKLFEQVSRSAKSKTSITPITAAEKLTAPVVGDLVLLPGARSSQGLIGGALIKLLTAILSHVGVSADMGDEILVMLGPFSTSPEYHEIKEALQTYNADALWLRTHLLKKSHPNGPAY